MTFTAFNSPLPPELTPFQELLHEGVGLYQKFIQTGGQLMPSPHGLRHSSLRRVLQERQDGPVLKQATQSLKSQKDFGDFLSLASALKEEKTWQELEQHQPDAHLARLKKSWLHQKEKAHFTTEALYEANDLLQELVDLSRHARQAIPKRWVKQHPQNAKAYASYLDEVEKVIVKEQQEIAETLYFRLKVVLKEKRLNHHNPMAYLVEKLHALHIEPPTIKPGNSLVKHPGTAFDCAKALAYIQHHGSRELKDTLSATLNLSIGDKPLLLRQQKEKSFFIPESFAAFVPEQRAVFPWLFRGEAFRYRFFRHQSPLLFQLASLYQPGRKLEGSLDFNHPDWLNLCQLQSDVSQALLASLKKPGPWPAFLFRDARALSKQWQSWLFEQQKELMKRQLDYLCAMAKAPIPLEHVIEKNIDNLLKTKNNMTRVFMHLEEQFKRLEMDKTQRLRFQQAKQDISARWGFNESKAHYVIASILNHLAESRSALPAEHIIRFDVETALLTSTDKASLAQTHQNLLFTITEHLGNALAELPSQWNLPEQMEAALSVIKQQLCAITPFVQTAVLRHHERFVHLAKDMQALIEQYRCFILEQEPDFLAQNEAHFRLFEQMLYKIAAIHPHKKSIDETLLEAFQARFHRANGQSHIDTQACIQALQQERVSREKRLEAMEVENDELLKKAYLQIASSRASRQHQKETLKAASDYLNGKGFFPDPKETTGTSGIVQPPETYTSAFH